jgi:hypothetical protein
MLKRSDNTRSTYPSTRSARALASPPHLWILPCAFSLGTVTIESDYFIVYSAVPEHDAIGDEVVGLHGHSAAALRAERLAIVTWAWAATRRSCCWHDDARRRQPGCNSCVVYSSPTWSIDIYINHWIDLYITFLCNSLLLHFIPRSAPSLYR